MFENLGAVGLRADDLKLSWDLERGMPVELYDLASDPSEVRNRVLDPALRPELAALVDELRARRPLPVDRWNG